MPALTEMFGILPWHLGGEERLTYDEIQSYIDHFNKVKREEAKQVKALQQQRQR